MTNKIINYKNWNTYDNSIPFEEIKIEEILPAIKEGIKVSKEEVDKVKNNSEEPTFENTIIPLESGDRSLSLAHSIMHVLSSAKNSEELTKIEKEVTEILVEFQLSVEMDSELFKKVESIYKNKDNLELTEEELTVLENRYKGFLRSGVHLVGEEREAFEKVSKEISELSIIYDENMKKEAKDFFLEVSKEELKGLSEETINFCYESAKARGIDGYGIVFDRTFIVTELLKFLESRKLREKLWKAVMNECAKGNETDNREVIKKIVNARQRAAQILGFETYADFALEDRMAKNKETVNSFLEELKNKSMAGAKRDVKEVSDYAEKIEGEEFVLMPWDFRFYSEKLRNEKYSFDEKDLMKYFSLRNIKDATFDLIGKMYGISFKVNEEVQTWNEDVEVYEAYSNQEYLGLIYFDLFMRPGVKKTGAWMYDFIAQSKVKSEIRPHIEMCMNLKKGEDKNPLMTMRDVETYLHEFGHVLHGLLSKVTFESVAGTNVYRDFVELPSQLMENFFYERELFLDSAAKHVETNEKMSDELYEKIKRAQKFEKGYQALRQLSFGLQDMSYYSLKEPLEGDVIDFEEKTQKEIDLFPEIEGFRKSISTNFPHIFSFGYAAGYYSYKWAEVLDADAFLYMKENNFSKEVMNSFKENVLEKGGSVSPDILYKRFRGEMPNTQAMLKRDGLIE